MNKEECFNIAMKLMMDLPSEHKNYNELCEAIKALNFTQVEKGRRRLSSYWLHNPTSCMLWVKAKTDSRGKIVGAVVRHEYSSVEYWR